MEPLLVLFAIIVVPSIVGALSYLFCRKIRPTSIHLLIILAIYFVLISFFSGLFSIGAFFLLVGVVVSKLGAWAHRKSTEKVDSNWGSSHQLVLTSTLLSLLFGILILIVSLVMMGSAVAGALIILPLYMLTLLVSPSMMPFLIWMKQSSYIRPGVDKHLES